MRYFSGLIVAAMLLFGGTWSVEVAAKSDKAKGKPVAAGKPSKGSPSKSSSGDPATTGAIAGAVLAGILLSDQDRQTITRYFQEKPVSAKPLPPGIAKNLARGKPLPPGIAKRGVPADLESRLSIPKGYTLETVGTDVMLIREGSRIIAEILKDVLSPGR